MDPRRIHGGEGGGEMDSHIKRLTFPAKCSEREIEDSQTLSTESLSQLEEQKAEKETSTSPLRRSAPASFSQPPPKRLRSEDKPSDENQLRSVILEWKRQKLNVVTNCYNEHLLELFFLDHEGNLMDMPSWLKKPTPELISFVKENKLEGDNSLETRLSVNGSNSNSTSSLPFPNLKVSEEPNSPPSTPIPKSSSLSSKSSKKYGTSDIKHKNLSNSDLSLANSQQDQMVEKARQEAYIMQRIAALRKKGLWGEKRLPKVQEAPRPKAHWDYLLEEMVWLSADFAQERKWKKAAAKKCAKMVQKYFQDKALQAQKAEKEQEMKLRKIAAFVAKEVRTFWSNVGKLVEFKVNARLDEKKKKALDQQLSFIVDQTEKYSSMLAESMTKSETANSSTKLNTSSKSIHPSDDEFKPEEPSDDDEATILKEDDNPEEQASELQLLQKESQQSLEDVLSELPPDYFENREANDVDSEEESQGDKDSVSSETQKEVDTTSDPQVEQAADMQEADGDQDFEMNESEDDDEATIQEQEDAEMNVNHEEELMDLQAENKLSVEELRKKYAELAAAADPVEEEEDSKSDVTMKSIQSEDEEVDDDNEEIVSDKEEETLGLEDLLGQSFSQSDEEVAGSRERSEKVDKELQDASAVAESLQPKGFTLSSTSVTTPVPFLLKHKLREYQHVGLDWLVTMYEKKLNGILADEMGLGKTIQTIALLAHLACEKKVWGPHLIVVPTSVMLNWEMEFKKWCPAFKILTYYGSQKERKLKRQGWTKNNAFHVCITSYKLVIQDHQSFRRKRWRYFILDEAQNIKNFKSQRWQLLLNFQSHRRLLLTGTPLQNSLMELWSLMHFLMPNIFASHREFREWFSNPVTGMIEGNKEYNDSIIKRLHKVLRPFILRRLKTEVEQQMPKKYEHIVMCRLSKRQRFLYEEFMSRTKTKQTLASGNFLSVINILMQLRKVCNHPNLFEPRPTISPFMMNALVYEAPSLVYGLLKYDPFKHVDLFSLNLLLSELEMCLTAFAAHRIRRFQASPKLIQEIDSLPEPPPRCPAGKIKLHVRPSSQPIPKLGTSGLYGNQRASAPSVVTLKPVNAPLSAPSAATPTNASVGQPQSQPSVRFQLVQQGGSYKAIPLPPGSTGGMLMQQTPQGPRLIMPQRSVQASTPTATVQSNIAASSTSATSSGSVGGLQLVQTSAGQYLLTSAPLQKTTSNTASSMGLSGNTAVAILQRIQGIKGLQGSVITTGAGGRPVLRLPTSTLRPTIPTSGASTTSTSSNNSTLTNSKTIIQNSNSAHLVSQLAASSIKMPQANSSQSSASNSPITSPAKPPKAQLQVNETKEAEVSPTKKEDITNKSVFYLSGLEENRRKRRREKLHFIASLNTRRCHACPIYGSDLMEAVSVLLGPIKNAALGHEGTFCGQGLVHCLNAPKPSIDQYWQQADSLHHLVNTPETYLALLKDITDRFVFCVPSVVAPIPLIRVSHPHPSKLWEETCNEVILRKELAKPAAPLHSIVNASVTQFPDPRLIQYDCGKLQTLDKLLRQLKSGSHRVLIFTQMTKMLDVFEAFLNFHGHLYLRLDGTTRVEQRQNLMERFNQDKRIFAFILSTRSGGIGVNLTGADTVIFYDSDWNPTMDAQAQDRCHRIGQTRDVHIYRLISERTIEENILKKANQKRLLGDLAIEGGNFTTASLKTQTIHDLFVVDVTEQDVSKRMKEVLDKSQEEVSPSASREENAKMGEFENALAVAEDETDVEAAKTAKAEAAAELAEFDENIPLEEHEGEEVSKAEQEVALLMTQLTPIEKYAMNFLEQSDEGLCAEAERLVAEIEQQKKEWELGRLQALQEEQKRLHCDDYDEDEALTYSSFDARNQLWVSSNDKEIMPIWQPPTPPRDENDLYLDQSLSLWYNTSVTMAESELPPIYVKKESNKRIKIEPSVITGAPEPTPSLRGPTKIKREETTSAPRSLFDWRDLKKDMKLHKYSGLVRPSLGALKQQQFIGKPSDSEPLTEWLIHEDWNIVQAIQQILQLPLNLSVLSHGHTPNWDLVGDLVNSFSVCYRSQRQCKNRYENTLVFREENKEGIVQENMTKKLSKKNKGFGTPGRPSSASRGLGTFQLFQQDNNSKYSSLYGTRFETIKSITVKKTPTMKPMHVNPASKNSKHAQILCEHGIQYEDPLTPSQVAANRAERLQREKKTQAELVQQQQQQQQQTRLQMQSQPQSQITTVNQLHRQLQQVHQAHQIVQQQQQQQQHVAVVAAGTSSTQQQQPVVVSTGGITGKMATSVVLNQGLGTNLVSVSGSIVSSGVTTIVTTSTSVPTTATATILSGVRTAVTNQTAPTCRTAFTLQGTTQATVVSVASLAQLQTAKLNASLTSQATQQRGITGVPVQTRTIMPQQLPYLRQAQRQTLAFQPGKVVATSTTGDQQTIKRVQIAGQSSTGQKVQVAVSSGTVPGITAIQMVKPGTMVATAGTSGASANQAKTRTFSESEMNALLRRQPQQIAHAKARGIAQVLKQRSLVGMKGATVGVQLGSKTGTVQILQGPTQKHLTVQQYQLLKQVQQQQQQQQQQPQIIQQGTVVAKAIATGATSSGSSNGGITQAALTSQSTKLIPVTVSTQQQPIKQTIQVVSAGSSAVGAPGSSGLRVSSGERATGITLQGSAVRVANPTLLSLGSAALQGQPVSVAVRTPSSNSVRIQTTTLPSHQQTTTTIATTQQQPQSGATASPH